MGEIRDRLEKMKRLVELRERLGKVAEGEDVGGARGEDLDGLHVDARVQHGWSGVYS